MENGIESTIRQVNAPLIYDFANFVLDAARKRGLTRIYFLARDGYEPYKFSQKIAERSGMEMDLRYIYASRMAWRLPVCALLSKEECFRLMFEPSLSQTPVLVLDRIGASEDEKEAILKGTEFEGQKNKILQKKEWLQFRSALANNPLFYAIMKQNSEKALPICQKYFEQEGMTEGDFAICDSGWSATMQRCLQTMLRRQNSDVKVIGIYFGLYRCPKSISKQTIWYYFGPNERNLRKLQFSNNLLECMLLSPNGTTVGYREAGEKVVPIFRETTTEYFEQEDAALHAWLKDRLSGDVRVKEKEKLQHTVQRVMYKPSERELRCFARYAFSDDPSERDKHCIVRSLTKDEAKGYLVCRRLLRKLFHKGDQKANPIYWLYGSIAYSNLRHKWWYRWNAYVWEAMRLVYDRIGKS